MVEKTGPARVVTNDEFNEAYYGGTSPESKKAAADNRGIINGVKRGFRNKLSQDDLDACGFRGLWKALIQHDESYNQKFTCSLHRFVYWECLKVVEEQASQKKLAHEARYYHSRVKRHFDGPEKDSSDISHFELGGHIMEVYKGLNCEWTKRMIDMYVFEDLTLEQIGERNGFTKEAARTNVRRALNSLSQNCRAKLGFPIPVYLMNGD